MAAQIAVVMLAGYETTSTALGFTAYELALNPHVQKKIQDEIDEYFPNEVLWGEIKDHTIYYLTFWVIKCCEM